MKTKNGEAAVLQALRENLEEIPFLQVTSNSLTKDGTGLGFRIKVRVQDNSYSLLGEYKSSGQPRLAHEAAYALKDRLAKGLGSYGFTAPYVSPAAAAVCKQNGIGYLDLAGNCRLSFGTIHIQREGRPNSSFERREYRSLYSPKAERILRVLLTVTQQDWKTGNLAEAARVSFGQVSNVRKILAEREWLDPNRTGMWLNKPGAVLDEWAKQYRFRRSKVLDYYAMAEVAECEYALAEACNRQGLRYALTAFSGAARLAPAVRYQRAMAYVDATPDTLANDLGWKPVESGANVSLVVPYDEGVFYGGREIESVQVATPVQIYLDLQASHGRGQEAAQAVRKEIERAW